MTHKTIAQILVMAALLGPPLADSRADSIGTAQPVVRSYQDGATMSIPRWKAYVLPSDPDRIWLMLANWGADGDQLVYTTNAGTSWQTPDIYMDDNYALDYHSSLAGKANGDVLAVFPEGNSIVFRRVAYPAQSNSDRDPLRTVRSFSAPAAANIMVQPDNQRIWVFTRLGDSPSENVRYHYSDNDGASWTSGTADPTGWSQVRIGSMPYVGGRPALVVQYLSSSLGFRYYLWNGSAFEARPDAQIYVGNLGTQRVFCHNVIEGNYFHLIFGLDNTLHHYWKAYNNGSGSWNHEVIDQSSYTSGNEWEDACAVRGNELFVFYCKKSSSSISTSNVYYCKWTQATESWSSPVLVSNNPSNTTNHFPNTSMSVPTSADYVPVFWYSHLGNNNEQVYFNKITVTSGGGDTDTIPPAPVNDLSADPGDGYGQIDLDWTAPGDDGSTGTVDHYEIRYGDQAVTAGNWSSATVFNNPPTPVAAGGAQHVAITGLDRGGRYYIGLRSVDEAGNPSDIASSGVTFAGGIMTPTPVNAEVDMDTRTVQLTSDVVESYYSLVYEFSLDSLPSFGQARTSIDLSAGAEASAVFDNIQPGETYYWKVRAKDATDADSSLWSSTQICNSPSGVNDTEGGGLPISSRITGGSPNPSHGGTTVFFALAQRSHVKLEVYNLLGRRVTELLDSDLSAGEHYAYWDGADAAGAKAAPGVYFFRLQATDAVDSRKVVLLR